MTWIVIGVSSGVPWPREESNVSYRGLEFILRPETETSLSSLALNLAPTMRYQDGLSRCREFLSALCWVDNAPIREEIVSGGGYPVAVGKGPQWRSIQVDRFRSRFLPEPTDPKAKLALALYREAHNVNSVPYKFLGFFKILNIINKSQQNHTEWINSKFMSIKLI